MPEEVKHKRAYRSARRQEQADETRKVVLDAARELFKAGGWQNTTIAQVATRAGVSKETIYATYSNKRSLLEAVIESAVRGAQPGVPLLDQKGPRSVAEAPGQAQQISAFAVDIAEVLARVAPLIRVVRTGAEADPELVALYQRMHAGRKRNLAFVIDALLKNGPLRLERDAALDTLWRLVSPELYLLITEVEGLPAAAYAKWLEDSLRLLLLGQQTG